MSGAGPTTDDLRAIARQAFGVELASARRFRTGLCHYVYDVALEDRRRVVLRIARPENRHYLVGAMHWSKALRPLGVPLPELLHARVGARRAFPYIALARLAGRDLGQVYPQLAREQKRTLASRLAAIQQTVGTLPAGTGFGYQTDPRQPPPHRTWAGVVEAGIQRSEGWLAQTRVVDGRLAARLRQAARRLAGYFNDIPPQAFLDDITTKNVLIARGRLTGIVDVDMVCFGDRVAHLGLTRMALLADGRETDYIEYWAEALRLNDEQRRALDFYTAESCLCFIAEEGQAFNRDNTPAVDCGRVAKLQRLFNQLL